jgi:hypothetical protein
MLFFFGCVGSSVAGEGITIRLDEDSPALHFPIGNKIVQIDPAFEDYSFMMFDVCDAMKLSKDECTIFPMNGDLGGNAIATIFHGNRLIIYDRKLSPLVGATGAMAVIAHELGHHFCGHIGRPASPHHEIEADRFAGAALRNSGISLDQALSVAEIFSNRPSRSHPGRAERVTAIADGWNNPASARHCR